MIIAALLPKGQQTSSEAQGCQVAGGRMHAAARHRRERPRSPQKRTSTLPAIAAGPSALGGA